jgi:large subunit ribosomal protein L24
MIRTRLKKDDQVVVLTGTDKGKRGKILFVDRKNARVIVEGINKKTKYLKQGQEGQKGQMVQIEYPINISNVSYFCDKCKKGTRIGIDIKDASTKARICKKCGKSIDKG